MPDQHEPRLVREVKEHRQVERREKEGRRRTRIQAGKERREQVEGGKGEKRGSRASRSTAGKESVVKAGSTGGNMEWSGGSMPVWGGGLQAAGGVAASARASEVPGGPHRSASREERGSPVSSSTRRDQKEKMEGSLPFPTQDPMAQVSPGTQWGRFGGIRGNFVFEKSCGRHLMF